MTVTKITQKYLEPGHTQMEVDSVHSVIERAKKGTEVFVPRDWINIIALARKKSPYTVVTISNEDFIDAKQYTNEQNLNFKILQNNNKVNWRNIKCIQLEKHSQIVKLKYDLNGAELELNLKQRRRKSCRKGRDDEESSSTQYCTLQRCYKEMLPISEAKKKDLVDLCKSGIIPIEYHPFYDNLKDSSTQQDRLPEPDVEDSDESDDNE